MSSAPPSDWSPSVTDWTRDPSRRMRAWETSDRQHAKLLFVARRDCLFAAPFYASRSPDAYPAKRRNTRQALCPPKPNEFDIREADVGVRASFGT